MKLIGAFVANGIAVDEVITFEWAVNVNVAKDKKWRKPRKEKMKLTLNCNGDNSELYKAWANNPKDWKDGKVTICDGKGQGSTFEFKNATCNGVKTSFDKEDKTKMLMTLELVAEEVIMTHS